MRELIETTIKRAKRGGIHTVGRWSVWCEPYQYHDMHRGCRAGFYIHVRHEDGTRFSKTDKTSVVDAMVAKEEAA